MDTPLLELATRATQALEAMAARSPLESYLAFGDLMIGLIQCGLIGYGLYLMRGNNEERLKQSKTLEAQTAALEAQTQALATLLRRTAP